MAYAERRNNKLTGRYVCDAEFKHTDGSVDRWHKAFASKQEAEGAEAYFRATGQKPPHLTGTSSDSFAEVAERFKRKNPEWLQGESNAQRLEFAITHLGKLPVTAVRRRELEDFVDKIDRLAGRAGRKPAHATVNRYLDAVGKVLQYAWELELISGRPVFPRRDNDDGRKRGSLTWAQEDAICARLVELGNTTEAFLVRALAATGMRCGELFAIDASQIETPEQPENCGILLRAEQTKAGKPRWVPLVLEGCNKLRAIIASGQRGKHHQLYAKFTRAAKWCGEIPQADLHWLRHTANTRMLDTGADSMIVSEILGHSTGRMTQRYYHPDKLRLFEVAKKVQGRCGEITKTSAVLEFAPKANVALSA